MQTNTYMEIITSELVPILEKRLLVLKARKAEWNNLAQMAESHEEVIYTSKKLEIAKRHVEEFEKMLKKIKHANYDNIETTI